MTQKLANAIIIEMYDILDWDLLFNLTIKNYLLSTHSIW